MNDKSLEIKVLDETIKVRNAQLKAVVTSIVRSNSKLESLRNDIRIEGIAKTKAEQDVTNVRKRLNAAIAETQNKIDAASFELRSIEASIRERKTYLEEQEKLIDGAVESGNEELQSIKYQIEDLHRTKQSAELEIHDTNEILDRLKESIAPLEQEIANLHIKHKTERATLDNTLHDILISIDNARLDLQRITAETDAKLSKLREREASIIARDDASRQLSADLALRERRLNSAERLYS